MGLADIICKFIDVEKIRNNAKLTSLILQYDKKFFLEDYFIQHCWAQSVLDYLGRVFRPEYGYDPEDFEDLEQEDLIYHVS